ncbi:hypothetical protein ORIO_06425 [Cereibacter azotoformans]|uniref:hypothetical protein n=1 Tax=Cereibacter azotoformans TaxID=43057 RepID=UPI001EEA8C9B|nr:hypothetical protein [Cereibacter azotoformans]ULB09559.1 hypothetical protein ORIO_06425 [Cereibacter azotoformans]
MMHQRIILPPPWHALEVFDLVEQVRETESDLVYRKRLYMVDRQAEGGRVLIKSGPEFSMPKRIAAEAAEGPQ